MQLYFIRHAQSSNNLLWEQTKASDGRSMDPELTEKGWQQVHRLAMFLLENQALTPTATHNSQNGYGFGLTHLYTSLMVRAVATGSYVARALDMPLYGWVDLHEEGGVYLHDPESGERVGQSGKDQAYFSTHHPELILPDGIAQDGWWNRPYENPEQSQERVIRFHNQLLLRHGNSADHVAVFSHGGFYNSYLRYLLGIQGESDHLWFVLNNTAITRIDFRGDETIVVYLNRADFLPADLIS